MMPLLKTLIYRRLTASDKIVLSFLFVILLGTFLLHLPICSASGHKIKLRDCLFTSTSAVCVTGLTVRDTGKEFTFLGQFIILCLIQVGGLGILTFSNLLLVSFRGGRGSLNTRMVMSESVGSLPQMDPAFILRNIFVFTFTCEGIGALFLFTRFIQQAPFGEAVWHAVFHSIAAFCNAGFSLFTNNLIDYQSDLVVNLTIMGLIIMGGLGFVVYSDLVRYFLRKDRTFRRHRLSFHSKVVLQSTFSLILFGAVLFILLEWQNTMKGFSLLDRLQASFFLSVTARTAGFNTVDTGQLNNASLLILMILMGIGASPGSTGGGIKTTTFTILIALVWSRSMSRQRIEWMNRSVPMSLVGKAVATAAAFTVIIFLSVILMEAVDLVGISPQASRGLFVEHLFEAVSAIGTVGLSTGITAHLGGFSQMVLIVLMFIGRLGPLLIAGSLIGNRKPASYTKPEDWVLVG